MAVRHADAGLDYFGASSMIAGWVGWLCQVSLGGIGSVYAGLVVLGGFRGLTGFGRWAGSMGDAGKAI